MKRYLTVGIIFGILVAVIVTISWLAFPAWRNPASGGFLTLLGATLVGVLAFIQGGVSIWKDLKEEKKEEPKPASTSADLDVGGSVGGNLTVGNSNVINYYYQQEVEKNTEKHEPDYWALKHPYQGNRILIASGKDLEEVLFFQCGLELFGTDAAFGSFLLFEQVEGNMPKYG